MIPIIIFIFLAFVQITLLPFEIVVIVIILRSFLVTDRTNYYLAFALGLLLAFLSGYPLGIFSLIYLGMVMIIYLLKKAHFISHWMGATVVSVILLLGYHLLEKFLLGLSLNQSTYFIELALILPIFIILKFFEERFTPALGVKLKVGK